MILFFLPLLASLSLIPTTPQSSPVSSFIFNGFQNANLNLKGSAQILPNGLLLLTNKSNKQEIGHAFFPSSFSFQNSFFSFSTSFIFAIVGQYKLHSSEGIAFAVSPSDDLSNALPSQHFGLFNLTNNGDESNHIVAVELDTTESKEFDDINDNHVGIDVNGLRSVAAAPASFFPDSLFDSKFQNLSLVSGIPMRIWADFDAKNSVFNVTLAPINVNKPGLPLLSAKVNSSVFLPDMFVGLSSSTGSVVGSHYILGWSFAINEKAEEFKFSELPQFPTENKDEEKSNILKIILPMSLAIFLIPICVFSVILLRKRRKKLAKVVEEWETEFSPNKFSYKTLYKATEGFSQNNILGTGGFGEVYKGKLSRSKLEIAVKRISQTSKQGMKEFVSEISSIGRLRHKNLVQLLGYSRQRTNLMLVYCFMPNGSLEKYIFGRTEQTLSWKQRFHIIKGIAAGLLYLHEEWEKVVIHRDIKASNVLLDSEFNGKLGDFGLARLYDRGEIAESTRVMGTFGYLAPELYISGNYTTNSDVFAFGAFVLEVVCGRRPVELRGCAMVLVLVDWVMEFLKKGELLEVRDRRMGEEIEMGEVEMVLKVGLMCSHPAAASRPNMRRIVRYLAGEMPPPEMSVEDFKVFELASVRNGLVVGEIA